MKKVNRIIKTAYILLVVFASSTCEKESYSPVIKTQSIIGYAQRDLLSMEAQLLFMI